MWAKYLGSNYSLKLLNFIHFGMVIQYLVQVWESTAPTTVGDVFDSLNSLFEYIEGLNLKVTSNTGTFINLNKIKRKLKNQKKDDLLSEDSRKHVSNLISKINDTILGEVRGLHAHLIKDKKIAIEKLWNIQELMSPNTFNALPDLVQYDLKESGLCILFERPTAAAFHVLRGMEGNLYWFYYKIIGLDRSNKMWNEIVQELRRENIFHPPKEILDQLDSIRRNYRNPTQHPEKIYDLDDVQDLLNECIAVTNRMVKFLKDNRLI